MHNRRSSEGGPNDAETQVVIFGIPGWDPPDLAAPSVAIDLAHWKLLVARG